MNNETIQILLEQFSMPGAEMTLAETGAIGALNVGSQIIAITLNLGFPAKEYSEKLEQKYKENNEINVNVNNINGIGIGNSNGVSVGNNVLRPPLEIFKSGNFIIKSRLFLSYIKLYLLI